MTTISTSRRRFSEMRRRVGLLIATYDRDVECSVRISDSPHKMAATAMREAVEHRLWPHKIPPHKRAFFRREALSLALWALRHEGNLDVCAAFGIEVVFGRRAMSAMAEVSAPLNTVTSAVAMIKTKPVPVAGFEGGDYERLYPLVARARRTVESKNPLRGRWLPTRGGPHLYGADPLCPPAEALALVGGWFTEATGSTVGLALHDFPAPRPKVAALGLGPFAGPMILAAMMPFHDIVVDGYPFTEHCESAGNPVGCVVNLASERLFRLAIAQAPQHDRIENLPGFIRLLNAARREVDGFGAACNAILRRLQRHRRAGLSVFVLGGPATHGVFASIASEIGLVPELLYGHDTSRCGIFVENPEGRSRRGIPHLPGCVVSLWRWS